MKRRCTERVQRAAVGGDGCGGGWRSRRPRWAGTEGDARRVGDDRGGSRKARSSRSRVDRARLQVNRGEERIERQGAKELQYANDRDHILRTLLHVCMHAHSLFIH